jgi:hypothetical protein
MQPFERTAAIILEGCAPDPDFTLSDIDMIIEEPAEQLVLEPFRANDRRDKHELESVRAAQEHSIVAETESYDLREAQRDAARFHVVMSETFGYDIYLQKIEEKELTVGCARDNNIVLPHTQSRRHPLRIFYSQGKFWVEDKKSKQPAHINGEALAGTRSLQQGEVIKIGEATIELVEV